MTRAPTYGETAEQLLANGWRPVPLQPATKQALVRGWGTRGAPDWRDDPATPTAIAREVRGRFGGWAVGLVAGPEVAFLDLDIDDLPTQRLVMRETWRMLGATPLIRVGRKPRCVLIYRRADPERGTLSFKRRPIEVSSGSCQVAVFGWHPGAGRPYLWLGAHTPLTIAADDPAIPAVTAAQLAAWEARIDTLLAPLREKEARVRARVLGVPAGRAQTARLLASPDDGDRWRAAREGAERRGFAPASALAAYLATIIHGGRTGPHQSCGNAHASLLIAAARAVGWGWSRAAFVGFVERWGPPSLHGDGLEQFLSGCRHFRKAEAEGAAAAVALSGRLSGVFLATAGANADWDMRVAGTAPCEAVAGEVRAIINAERKGTTT